VVQRAQVIAAMAEVVAERSFAGVSVTSVAARAKVSPRTFYELFDGLQDCFLAVIDAETDRASRLMTAAFEQESCWRDGLRSALTSLLVLLDSEPALARLWLVEMLSAGSWALERRERNLSRLTALIGSAWALPDGWEPPPLAAESVTASVVGVLHAHALRDSGQPHVSLLGPLMGVIVRPYLPRREVVAEIERGRALAAEILAGSRAWPLEAHAGAPLEIPRVLADPGAHRARRCLLYIAENPGASNRTIATAIGVFHQGQISTLLARLAGLGLLAKEPGRPGRPNAWRLADPGERVAGALAGVTGERPRTFSPQS
jgi:AcrR family transcriptional regulator